MLTNETMKSIINKFEQISDILSSIDFQDFDFQDLDQEKFSNLVELEKSYWVVSSVFDNFNLPSYTLRDARLLLADVQHNLKYYDLYHRFKDLPFNFSDCGDHYTLFKEATKSIEEVKVELFDNYDKIDNYCPIEDWIEFVEKKINNTSGITDGTLNEYDMKKIKETYNCQFQIMKRFNLRGADSHKFYSMFSGIRPDMKEFIDELKKHIHNFKEREVNKESLDDES